MPDGKLPLSLVSALKFSQILPRASGKRELHAEIGDLVRMRLLAAATVAVVGLTVLPPVVAEAGLTVHVPDPAFAECLSRHLGDNADTSRNDFTATELLTVSKLSCDSDVEDLSGAESLTNLVDLTISGGVTDVRPLVGLQKFRKLFVDGVDDSLLSSIGQLTRLQSLGITGGGRHGRSVSTLSPLSSLTDLTSFRSDLVVIGDASLHTLASLPRLQDVMVRMSWTQGSPPFDAGSLSGLTNLTSLSVLTQGPLALAPLRNLHRLANLQLSGPGVTSLDGLPTLVDGGILSLAGSGVSDLTPVKLADASLARLDVPGTVNMRTLAGIRAAKVTSGLGGYGSELGTLDSVDGLQDVVGLRQAEFGSYAISDTSMVPCTVDLDLDDQYLELPRATVGVPVDFPIKVQGRAHVRLDWGTARYDDTTLTYTESNDREELTFQAEPCGSRPSSDRTVQFFTHADVAANPAHKEFSRTALPMLDSGWDVSVGQKLTVATGKWSPTPSRFSYRWLRDDRPVAGATAASYTVTAGDSGHSLGVEVTAHKSGYIDTAKRSNRYGVADKPVTSSQPTIRGAAVVGVGLEASPGAWAPGTEFDYQWLRGSKPIRQQNGATYTLTRDDLRSTISVQVSGHKDGYGDVQRRSRPTPTVTHGPVTGEQPTISGKAKVGKKLKAVHGTWAPKGVKFRYRWVRDGQPITHATKSKYKLKKKDAGTEISVRVTGRKTDYTEATLTSRSRRVQQ